MAGSEDLLTLLGRALPALDDAALAAMASPGLLRRAYKDLEEGGVEVPDPAAVPLELRVAGCAVRIPAAGPAAATCDCPAPGTCRHILAALLHLRRWLAERPPEPAPAASGPPYTLEEVSRWAGKKTLREARRLLAAATVVEVEEGGPEAVAVRFPEFGVECRHLPGAGLDGMISNAPPKVRRRFLAAAAVAWLGRHGIEAEPEEPGAEALREPAGAPRTRAQVLAETRSLFAEMLTVGLSHLSTSQEQRLSTLAVSALGANLPRLSRLLRALAGEVSLLLGRHARADEARLFLALARAEALCEALEGGAPPPELVGEHRSHYEPAGALELQGAGAFAWRTRSGHGGLTVLFWSPAGWLTWSESRPLNTAVPFKPSERYVGEGPWEGIASPREAARTRLTLLGARRNGEGRLSASAGSRALPLGPSRLSEVDFGGRAYTHFGDLRKHAASIHPVGLAERRPGDEIVVLRPARWGARGFDPVLQVYRWELIGEDGGPLLLEVPYDEIGRPVIETLETLDPARDGVWGLIGRLIPDDRGLTLSPAVLLRQKEPEIVSLGLAPLAGSARRSPDTRIEPPAGGAPPWLSRLEGYLGRIERDLESIAEAGRRAFAPLPESLEAAAQDLGARGLPRLAAALADLMAPEDGFPRRLCRARYLCHLHRQAAVRVGISGG
jgi:hypothetical protein